MAIAVRKKAVSSSNVAAIYELDDGRIGVEFKDGSTYVYDVDFVTYSDYGGSWGQQVWRWRYSHVGYNKESITLSPTAYSDTSNENVPLAQAKAEGREGPGY